MKHNKFLWFIISTVLMCVIFAPTALAAGTQTYSLRIVYEDENTPIQGAAFRLYHVADVSEDFQYTLTDDFAESGAVLKREMTNEDWVTATGVFADWAENHQLSPMATDKTNADGTIVFENTQRGLYLVTGESNTVDGYVYTPQPACVVVPGEDAASGETVVEPKYEAKAAPTPTPTPTPASSPDKGQTPQQPSQGNTTPATPKPTVEPQPVQTPAPTAPLPLRDTAKTGIKIAAYVGLLVLGVCLAGAGIYVLRKKSKGDNPQNK